MKITRKNSFSVKMIYVGAMLLPTPAFADFGIGINLGNMGFGVEANQTLSRSLGLRFGISGLIYKFDFKYDSVKYDVEQSIALPEIKLDWRPMEGIFRMTAGIGYYNEVSQLGLLPAPGDTLTIGNNTYTAAQIGRLDGKVSYHAAAPYLGVGWDFMLNNKKLSFFVDTGAYYRGRPKASLTSTGTVTANDLAVEANNIEGDSWTFIPVVRLGMLHRF